MSDVTEAERLAAAELAEEIAFAFMNRRSSLDWAEKTTEILAAALAAEREKARVPFLALADELDSQRTATAIPSVSVSAAAHQIRRAAEAAQ